jgi:sugar phosphate isomerase/epimerase
VTTGLSLANLSIADAGPLELIDAAAAAGFAGVNLWLVGPRAPASFLVRAPVLTPVVGDARLIREIKLRVAATGVRVFEASCGWLGPEFVAEEMQRVLDTLAEIGSRRLSIVGWDADRARLVEHLGTICATAAGYGVDATLEFMPYSAVRSLADGLDVLAKVGAPNLDLLVDALHLARSGGTPSDLRRVDPRRLSVVQICDAPAASPPPSGLADESRNRRLHPGDGDLPLRELLAVLPSDIAMEVEVPCAEDAALSIEDRARRCFERAGAFLAA